MLQYPNFNPIAFGFGPIQVHWYGLMYLFGFALAWILALQRSKDPQRGFNRQEVSDLIFYCAIGLVVGARLGYMFFYNFFIWLHQPLEIFKVWQGGMSFHGGLIGVVVATWLFSLKNAKKWVNVVDFLVPLAPLGIALGRLGNFINGELLGRITHVPWAMVFPQAGPLPRHPSQLYEMFLEGIVLFIVIWIFSAKKRPPFAVSALFLLLYGIFRFFIEFYREPDASLGFIWDHLTMGQLLTLPMIVIGMLGLFFSYRKS